MKASDLMWDLSRQYTRIKLCWFESLDASYEASFMGADALGFHIFRNQPLDDAVTRFAGILKYLPPSVCKTLLTDLELDTLLDVMKTLEFDAIQLYPDWSRDDVQRLRAETGVRLLKVMSARPDENFTNDNTAFLSRYESCADAILLDSFRVGGTGLKGDWQVCAEIVRLSPLPVFLAGGLTSENVGEALRTVRPFGVDVESGVSDRIPDGPLVKNMSKCKAFVDAVARADRELIKTEGSSGRAGKPEM
jgi:phosphoribosylanthranilate isomerase